MVDVSKIRIGDEVTATGTVLYVDNRVRVQFDHDCSAWVEPEHIVGHVPKSRPIAVGDTVTFKWDRASQRRRIVKAIDDMVAWLKDPDGGHCQAGIHMLVRVDDPS